MFTEAIKLIKGKEYASATAKLQPLTSSDDAETAAKANYLLGYINTRWDYKEKNLSLAERCLYSNLNGLYPHPLAYVLYADVTEDVNVATNYLNKGIRRFPDDPRIYEKLLQKTANKDSVVDEIREKGLSDPQLLGAVISYLIADQQWDKIPRFLFRVRKDNELNDWENAYLKLIEANVYLFCKTPNYQAALKNFEELIVWDTDNCLAYSHFLGLVYTHIKLGNADRAVVMFDRIPIGNKIYDFDDGPCPLGININFEQMYRIIFEDIIKFFGKDVRRKSRARVIYSMYLYYPSEIYDVCRYKKSDALPLANYLRENFDTSVAAALFNMRCHFEQFKEAYEILWEFLRNYEDPDSANVFVSEVIDNIPDNNITDIASQTITNLQADAFDKKLFLRSVFSELVKRMHSLKLFEKIRTIAQHISIVDILNSDCAFECAFAYGKENEYRAIEIYEGIIKNEPNNAPCINNLGVQFEQRGNFYESLKCYEKAALICPEEQLYSNNQQRVRKHIQEELEADISCIADVLDVDALEEIGYTIDFCKTIHFIDDTTMRDILARDLRECAVAIVARQDKLASIMCGSIIEALLMCKITERGISKYDISEISKAKTANNYVVSSMSLSELLYVARQEDLITINSYRLGHYVRDYRNIVHPAKEKRMKEEISHENVLMMWSVLKRISGELLHTT